MRSNNGAVERPLFARQGRNWVVIFRSNRAIIEDMKGLHDLARLLALPGDQIHCLDLPGRTVDRYAGDSALDAAARQELKARIQELQEELAEAEDMNDVGRAEQARDEMDRLIEALAKALGLGGRDRRLGNLSERARTTVTWRLRHAVRRLREVHEPLARHLDHSLRTGTFCTYGPEQPTTWRLVGDGRL